MMSLRQTICFECRVCRELVLDERVEDAIVMAGL